ncbi:PA3496 family putative envelope integrity protein [Agaribacterium sp. ZY112]|uniref:PA3496 family putative envelope integrity protein n=1 Tax=Agaribacterium sp. ZY112 TaxID=3233574 RepID=UPI00352500F2
MEMETIELSNDVQQSIDDSFWSAFSSPLNGTDSRRRLEDKLEDQRLRKALMDYDFDF